MKIRFNVCIYERKRDLSGNRYSLATITSTKTGNSLSVNLGWGGGSNAERLAQRVAGSYDAVDSSTVVLPCREYDRIEKCGNYMPENQATPEMVAALEQTP